MVVFDFQKRTNLPKSQKEGGNLGQQENVFFSVNDVPFLVMLISPQNLPCDILIFHAIMNLGHILEVQEVKLKQRWHVYM